MSGLLPVILVTSQLTLVADRVPDFNVVPSCRAATTVSAMANRTEDSCKQDEQAAKTKLDQEWTQFSAAQKSHCVQLSSLGGPASYVELITCLEMSKAANTMPRDLTNTGPGAGK